MHIESRVTDLDALQELYRAPSKRAAAKVFSGIDDASSRFIARCTLAVMSTSDLAGGLDTSPRGGPPGFIQQLDDTHVAIPDLIGNNRIDSLRNIIVNPWVGLLLVVPGKDETLRINGPTVLTTDADVLGGFTAELQRPKLAVVVQAAEVFAHCAKAFRRGRVWEPEFWAQIQDAPDLAEIYACQFGTGDATTIRDDVEQIYADELARD